MHNEYLQIALGVHGDIFSLKYALIIRKNCSLALDVCTQTTFSLMMYKDLFAYGLLLIAPHAESMHALSKFSVLP